MYVAILHADSDLGPVAGAQREGVNFGGTVDVLELGHFAGAHVQEVQPPLLYQQHAELIVKGPEEMPPKHHPPTQTG